MNLIIDFLVAFVLTILIESIILFVFAKSASVSIKYSVVLNSLTHPLFWFLMIFIFFENFIAFLFLEFVVFITEGFLLWKVFRFSFKKAFVISFCTNFISAMIGVII